MSRSTQKALLSYREGLAATAASGNPPVQLAVVRLARAFVEHLPLIISLPLICAFGLAALSILRAPTYTTQASFMPQSSEDELTRLTGLAAQFGFSMPRGKSGESPEFYADLVLSRQLLRQIVIRPYEGERDEGALDQPRRADLTELLRVEASQREVQIEETIDRLKERIRVRTDPETGVVEVSAVTPWPGVSRDIVQGLLDGVAVFNLDIRRSRARAERNFVEVQLAQAQRDLLSAEENLEGFLNGNRRYEQSPQLTFQYERLQRRVSLRQQVFTALSQSYEQARIDEVRNTPLITVVEAPNLPARPDKRWLLLRAILGLGLGLATACSWALLIELMRSITCEHPSAPQELVELARQAFAKVTLAWSRVRAATLRTAPVLVPILLSAGPASLTAQGLDRARQDAEQLIGRPVSEVEMLEHLRASGLRPDEIRSLVRRRGHDAADAEPYLAVLEGRASRVPADTNPVPLLDALRFLQEPHAPDTRGPSPILVQEAEPGPPIFGRDLFLRSTNEFEPVALGPVPPDYRLGAGDELVLVLTGAVEQAYELVVTREGWVVIPDVGRLFVHGRTAAETEEALYGRLRTVYSGIGREPGASTFFTLSVGRLRTNQVYVIGEVERPGAYTLGSTGTVMSGLYAAGGPRRSGSFRRVVVNPEGAGQTHLDVYDYLVEGRATGDVRLEHGDVIFVPVAGRRVQVTGPVTRPGIYEIAEGEGLGDVLRYAGGVEPTAELRRVQIERVLPATERSPGQDRAILDVSVSSPEDLAARDVKLQDGDRVTVFAVLERVENQVTLSGAVWRPGTYATDGRRRLWDIIEQAGGLLPDALVNRAQIQRILPNQVRRLIPVTLETDSIGRPLENPTLEGMDQVIIFAGRELREDRAVSVQGWVRKPGVYPFLEGMSVADLILRAGGLRIGAYVIEAEVSRVVIAQERTARLTERHMVPLDSAFVFEGDPLVPPSVVSDTDAASFQLNNLDAVYVRRAPGFDLPSKVTVTGEVHFPGPYSIESRAERLTDIVNRAGGVTDEGYLDGFQLWRVGPPAGSTASNVQGGVDHAASTSEEEGARRIRVGVDFVEATRHPASAADILLEPNDSIFVPRYVPTVDVRGAVAVPTKVLYRRGAGVDYYVRQAGGYLEHADKDRVHLRLANGKIEGRRRKFLIFGGGIANPDPGSTVNVPARVAKPGGGLETTEIVTILASVMTAAASVLVAAR